MLAKPWIKESPICPLNSFGCFLLALVCLTPQQQNLVVKNVIGHYKNYITSQYLESGQSVKRAEREWLIVVIMRAPLISTAELNTLIIFDKLSEGWVREVHCQKKKTFVIFRNSENKKITTLEQLKEELEDPSFLDTAELKSAFSHDIVSNRAGANRKARKAAKAWMDEEKVTEHKLNKANVIEPQSDIQSQPVNIQLSLPFTETPKIREPVFAKNNYLTDVLPQPQKEETLIMLGTQVKKGEETLVIEESICMIPKILHDEEELQMLKKSPDSKKIFKQKFFKHRKFLFPIYY